MRDRELNLPAHPVPVCYAYIAPCVSTSRAIFQYGGSGHRIADAASACSFVWEVNDEYDEQ